MKKEFVDWEAFENATNNIKDYIIYENIRVDYVYGLPRGGLCLAVKLSHLLGKPFIIELNDSYKNVLILDDITDSGETIKPFFERKEKLQSNDTVITWHLNTNNYRIEPDYYVQKTNKWVVYPWESENV